MHDLLQRSVGFGVPDSVCSGCLLLHTALTLCMLGPKGGVPIQTKLEILRLPDEEESCIVERLCHFTGWLYTSPFPHKLANMSRFMTVHLEAKLLSSVFVKGRVT